mgnify:CR=1 FL=1
MRLHHKQFILQSVTFFLSIVAAIIILKFGWVNVIIESTKDMKFLASIVAGFFYTILPTSAIALVVFAKLASDHSIIQVSILGGIGAMVADLALFRLTRKYMMHAIIDVSRTFFHGRNILRKPSHARNLAMTVVGGIMIASPLPDEIGIAILELSEIKPFQFAILSGMLHTVGIFIIVYLGRTLS